MSKNLFDEITDFLKKYGEDLDESDLKTAQTNLAAFMKRLLVMRFESSKEAFRKTLQNIIASNELIKRWYDEVGKIPIYKFTVSLIFQCLTPSRVRKQQPHQYT